MAKYLLVKSGIIENTIELDPANIFDGVELPLPPIQLIPQPDLPQPDLFQPDEPILDEDGKPMENKDGKVMMASQPSIPQPAIKQPPLEVQPPALPDTRYRTPNGYQLIQSDVGGPGQSWPLPAPVPVDPNIAIKAKIAAIDQTITTRRLSDAISGTENPSGWLVTQRAAQQTLRSQLT